MRCSRTTAITIAASAVVANLLVLGLIGWWLIGPENRQVATALPIMMGLAAVLSLASVVFRQEGLPSSTLTEPPAAPFDVPPRTVDLAGQEQKTQEAIDRLTGEELRESLRRSFQELREERGRSEFRVVVFGTGSAGKTSLINALLAREVGATDPIMGTTQRGEIHTEVIEGVEGKLLLTDTPGLSEFGDEGAAREREAKVLAEAADLILFVLDHDLIRAELDALLALAGLKKRLIVVFNKIDRFTDEDRAAVMAKLRERLKGKVNPEDIVAVSAAPRPIPVRVMRPDGTSEIHYEPEPPNVSELEARLVQILDREGPSLRAGNLLLRTRRIERQAAEALERERRAKVLAVIEKYQWLTAASVFASPVSALQLASGGTAQYQMVGELAQIYGIELGASRSRVLVGQMLASLLRLGLVEAATTLVAGLFKTSFIGYAAAGAVQAVTMAYLMRVSGLAFAEYFARGEIWGEGGINRALLRQFDATSRTEFLQGFIRQAVQKLVERAGLKPAADPVGERGA